MPKRQRSPVATLHGLPHAGGGDTDTSPGADRRVTGGVVMTDADDAVVEADEEVELCRARLTAVQASHVESDGKVAVLEARTALKRAERQLARALRHRDAAARAAAGEKPSDPVVPEFASLDAFVEDYVLPNWRHRQTSTAWCATWWKHAEAISRLEALWEGFEVLRREPPPALATWWRDHLDPHMRALTDESGTFAGCRATKHEQVHQQQDVWITERAPNGLFHTDTESPRQPARVRDALEEGA